MEYSVGSLADLISGQKTPNKKKVVKQKFTPIKKEVGDEDSETKFTSSKKGVADFMNHDNEEGNSFKTKLSKKLKIKHEKAEDGLEGKNQNRKDKPRKKKFKNNDNGIENSLPKKLKHDNAEDEAEDGLNVKNKRLEDKLHKKKFKNNDNASDNLLPKKSKSKKRKLDTSNEASLVDSDVDESSPKKQKGSNNEQNAAGRIKNKINKDIKNSVEYKDRTLFVGNIPIALKKEKIKKLFRKYGIIDSVRIRGIPVADPKMTKKVAAIKKEFHPDRNTVYAFIRFQNSEDAKKAEAENGVLFHDHHLRVHCCESEEKPDESKAIFVGNLPFNVEDEELWNTFKICGPISHVRVVRDGRTGMGKGFGYVNFKDSDSVQLALEMEKVTLKDRELRITLCDSSRASKRKLGKKGKGRHRNRTNEDGEEKPFKTEGKGDWKDKNGAQSDFAGSKFNDQKKKKKFSKANLEKKKLAMKLAAPKPEPS